MTNSAQFINTGTPALLADQATAPVTVNPSVRSNASSVMLPRIEMMRSCYGGTETMRQMGELFLPRYRNESMERWVDRLNLTACTNKLREAVDSASAKPFRNLVKIRDADPDLEKWMWNADGCGHHLHIVAHKFFNEAVLTGVSHILIDHPTTTDLPNLAAQKALNAKPFLRLVKPEDMLAAYYDTIGGEHVCVHARFSSSRVGFNRTSFAEEIVDQVYVVEPGVVQLWERPRGLNMQVPPRLGAGGSMYTANPIGLRYEPYPVLADSAGKWELKWERPHDLDRVPLVSMTAGEEEATHMVRPVFQDLAYKQREHWVSTSEHRNILSAARFPMLASSGVQIDENGPDGQGFEVGPWVVLTSPDAAGRWYYVEPKGMAIESGAKDLAAIEYQMDMLALNPVQATNRQYVPQNERSLAETRVNSVIHDLAIGCQDALQKALNFVGMWTGQDYSKNIVDMNFNFSGTDELAGKVGTVLDAVAKGVLSREAALRELVRLNTLDDDFDVEAELARDPAQAEMQMRTTVDEIQNQADADIKVAKATPKPPQPKADFGKGKTRPN